MKVGTFPSPCPIVVHFVPSPFIQIRRSFRNIRRVDELADGTERRKPQVCFMVHKACSTLMRHQNKHISDHCKEAPTLNGVKWVQSNSQLRKGNVSHRQPQRTFSVIIFVPSWKGTAEGNSQSSCDDGDDYDVSRPFRPGPCVSHRANTEGRAPRQRVR